MRNFYLKSIAAVIIVSIIAILAYVFIAGPPKGDVQTSQQNDGKEKESFTLVYTDNLQGKLLESTEKESVEGITPADFSRLFMTLASLRSEAEKRQEPVIFVDLGNSLAGDEDLSRLMGGIPIDRLLYEVPCTAMLFREREYLMGHGILEKLRRKFTYLGMNVNHVSPKLTLLYLNSVTRKKAGPLTVAVMGYYEPKENEEEAGKKYKDFYFHRNIDLIKAQLGSVEADAKVVLARVDDVEKLSRELSQATVIIPADFDSKLLKDSLYIKGKTPIAPYVDSRFIVGTLHFTREKGKRKWKITTSIRTVEKTDEIPPGGILNVVIDARQNLDLKYRGKYQAIYENFCLWVPELPDRKTVASVMSEAFRKYTGVQAAVIDLEKIRIPESNRWGSREILDLPGKPLKLVLAEIKTQKIKALPGDKYYTEIKGIYSQTGSVLTVTDSETLKALDESDYSKKVELKVPGSFILLDYVRANRGALFMKFGGDPSLGEGAADVDRGEYGQAALKLKEALEKLKGKAKKDGLVLLGMASFKKGDFEGALKSWQAALKLFPEDRGIKEILEAAPGKKVKPVEKADLPEGKSLWPKFRGDLKNNGRSSLVGPKSNLLKWRVGTERAILASPVIGPDGTVYIGGEDTHFYAISPEGKVKWKRKFEMPIRSTAAVGPKGNIYFGCDDNHVYCLSPEGKVLWKFKGEFYFSSSPAVTEDGTIYVGCEDGVFYAINPDGREKWKYKTGGLIRSSPAVSPDGTIYAGSEDHNLYAFTPEGKVLWKYETEHKVNGSPAVDDKGNVYVGSEDRFFYALSKEGRLLWRKKLGNYITSSPSIGPDGRIYIGSEDKKMYALSPAGDILWTFETGGEISSTPLVDAEGNLYFGSDDGNFYALNSKGEKLWVFMARDPVMSSPAMSGEGIIYVGSEDRNIYAIGD